MCILFSEINNDILVADIQEKEEAQKKYKESEKRGQRVSTTVEAR